MLDLSVTTILYLPAFRVLTFFPPFVSEIVKPGPTTPLSVGVDVLRLNAAPAAASATAMTNVSTAAAFLFIRLLFGDAGRYGRDPTADLAATGTMCAWRE